MGDVRNPTQVLPDGGAALLHRVQSLPPPSASRNARCVDLDDLLELANATWAEATKTWTAHLDFLYQRHANLYRVKEEMRFANDNGLEDRDAVLARRPSGIAPRRYPATAFATTTPTGCTSA